MCGTIYVPAGDAGCIPALPAVGCWNAHRALPTLLCLLVARWAWTMLQVKRQSAHSSFQLK